MVTNGKTQRDAGARRAPERAEQIHVLAAYVWSLSQPQRRVAHASEVA